MGKKNINKDLALKNIQNLFKKNIKLDKFKVNPINAVEDAKNKLEIFTIIIKKREKKKN